MAEQVISNIFCSLDADGSGAVTKEEMDICFKIFDKDGNGSVSKEEWTAGFVSNFKGSPDQAEKSFKYLDKSAKGEIDIKALYDLFGAMDTNGDGDVSKEEFTAFWLQILS